MVLGAFEMSVTKPFAKHSASLKANGHCSHKAEKACDKLGPKVPSGSWPHGLSAAHGSLKQTVSNSGAAGFEACTYPAAVCNHTSACLMVFGSSGGIWRRGSVVLFPF